MAGHAGVVGIAAHNTCWLGFAAVQPGDEVQLETRYGAFRYMVSGIRVVSPSDGSVLWPAAGRQRMLTKCWPLWAGSLAPQRLAIFGRQARLPGLVGRRRGDAPIGLRH
jgi:LPXTG-site transpeptidase (sortase) family protein